MCKVGRNDHHSVAVTWHGRRMCKVGRNDHHSVAVTWHGRRMCKVGRNDHHSVAVTWHWSHIYHTMTLSLYKKKNHLYTYRLCQSTLRR
jgi:hypothetical protein